VTTAADRMRGAEGYGVTLARSWRCFPEICDRTTTRDHDGGLPRMPWQGIREETGEAPGRAAPASKRKSRSYGKPANPAKPAYSPDEAYMAPMARDHPNIGRACTSS
jgi:hypothetical protein